MTPNISEARAVRLLSLYEAAEREILRKLAKRFAGVPDTARIPAWIARKQAEVLKAVQEITVVLTELEAASREMRAAMIETAYMLGAESFNEELPKQGADGLFNALDISLAPESAQALVPLMDDIDGRFSELHRRILREAEDEYRKIIADVLPNAALGVDSVREATRAALNAFANKGIAGFTDRAGRFWGMAEYAEMAVRTGLKLAHIAGFTQNALAKGYDLVIISDHADTCPICSKWERKVLSLTGMQADDPECDGWLADAQREGLFHPNCQHDMAVYVPGQTDRRAGHDISAEGRRKDEQGYNNRQKQRYYERMVRRWKRRQAAALTPEDEREARGHVAQWQKKLRTLTTEAHLRRKYEREGGRVLLSEDAKRLKPFTLDGNGGIINTGGAMSAVRNTGKQVYFNPQASYTVKLDGYSETVNAGISKAIRDVAMKGSESRTEHMYLVNLDTGGLDYYETNGEFSSVGYEFREYLTKHSNEQFAFVHNHNTDGSFSESDMHTLLTGDGTPVMIAVRNDGIIYVAERAASPLLTGFLDSLYPEEMDALNKRLRDGTITMSQRTRERESLLVNNTLRDYTKGGRLIEYGE